MVGELFPEGLQEDIRARFDRAKNLTDSEMLLGESGDVSGHMLAMME